MPDAAYTQLLARLSRRGQFRIQPGLERVACVLDALGHPQDLVATLHIAGTNGKGSVAACLESILRQAGYRTGLYTSPHLIDLRERIQMDGQRVSPDAFQAAAQKVLAAERRLRCRLTYFEFLTVAAFVAFADARMDITVLETGMGGRWDATNAVAQPELEIITSIGKDHTQWLGRTEKAIAREKAGIIKPGTRVISGVRGLPGTVISKVAKQKGSQHWQIDDDFKATGKSISWNKGHQEIHFESLSQSGDYRVHLLGTHQIDNAGLVLAAVEVLRRKGWTLPDDAVRSGLAGVFWPGRFQLIQLPRSSQSPAPAVLDGAHNPHALRRLLETLDQSPWQAVPKTFVFSTFRDKDYREMARLIAAQAQRVILCVLPTSRALSLKRLRAAFKDRISDAQLSAMADPAEALKKAVQQTPSNGLVVATGSLALIGELLRRTQKPTLARTAHSVKEMPGAPRERNLIDGQRVCHV